MIQITKVKCPSNKIGIKCPYAMSPEYITVHNTANDASAIAEISYMLGNNRECSFHFAVDDTRAVQGIDLNRNTWHAGDGNGTGNRKSISIEICYSKSGGDRFIKAEQNGAQLVAYLLKQYGWSIERVKKHQDWSGKYCPHRTLDMGWDRFLNMVKSYMNGSTAPTTSQPLVPSTSNNDVNVYYRVRTQKHGWLSEVKNLTDYAGWENSPVTGLAIRVDKGSIKYQVHTKSGRWLGWITRYNLNDAIKGYAGNGEVIDAIRVYYFTPDGLPYKYARYRVNNYSTQIDTSTKNRMDGYAGKYGVPVTKFRLEIR